MSERPTTPETPGLVDGGRHLTRYDLLLAVVPVAFLLGLLAALLADVPLRTALGSAAMVSALALLDGLFLNPPRRPRTRPRGDVEPT